MHTQRCTLVTGRYVHSNMGDMYCAARFADQQPHSHFQCLAGSIRVSNQLTVQEGRGFCQQLLAEVAQRAVQPVHGSARRQPLVVDRG